jgi:hypothetical protein
MRPLPLPATAVLLAVALATPSSPRAAPPARKAGKAKVTLSGGRTASGTFPAVCGPYFMMDVKGIAKAGDGLVFETDVAGVGHLQVNSEKRVPGRATIAGIILNPTSGAPGSYVGDAAAPNQIVFGPKLDTAKVKATLRNLRARRGDPPDVVKIEAEFDCRG